MFNKLKSLVVVLMLVFISACAEDGNSGGGQLTGYDMEIDEIAIIPTEEDIYEIYNAGNLAWVSNQSKTDNFIGKTIKFMSDIDMENKLFVHIRSFAGRIEGNNKKMSNVNIGNDSYNGIGLIGLIEDGGYIENLTIESGIVRGDNMVGAFAGSIKGTVTLIGVKNNAEVRGAGRDVGGLIGDSHRYVVENILTIENSSNGGKVTGGGNHVGGLIGMNYTTLKIINSSNSGVMSGGGSGTGGLIGRNYTSIATIDNSFNNKSINGVEDIGGLVGITSNYSNLTIKNSSNSGALTSVTYPIVDGEITGGASVGGIVGFVGYSELSISNSSNTANISAEGEMVAGIVGNSWHGTIIIDNSSNSGDIVSTAYWGEIGGIVGWSNKSLIIDNSSNSGDLEATRFVGGIIGFISGEATLTNVHSYAVKMTATAMEANHIGGIVSRIGKNTDVDTGTVTATNVYWLHDDTVATEVQGVVVAVGKVDGGDFINTNSKALNKAKFKVDTNFTGWDFTADTGIWELLAPNGLYPTLRNLPKAPVAP